MSLRVRRDAGLYGYERALGRAGLAPVAGVDEAGRGACAGPLVAAACILPERRPITELADSKLLSAAQRERCFEVIQRRAVSWAVVIVDVEEVDARGVHKANLAALRRAVLRLQTPPAYVLSDGFPVDGLTVPSLAVWKGDRVAACVAAASVLAKVTRDRIMVDAEQAHPGYDFAVHKGYATATHQGALRELGPSPFHRRSFANVAQYLPSAAEVAQRDRPTG